MENSTIRKSKNVLTGRFSLAVFCLFALVFLYLNFFGNGDTYYASSSDVKTEKEKKENEIVKVLPPLDKEAYDRKLIELANIIKPTSAPVPEGTTPPIPKPDLWPVKTVYPNAGAILPFKRIIAYYGNLYSKKMGVLGEYPEDEMLSRLDVEIKKWNIADPTTEAIPALHYIAVTAQLSPGEDGKYRLRMPDKEIDKVLKMAERIGALVFLDIQVGFSTVAIEVPRLEKYLKMPNVHLGLDPEFSMKSGVRPGKIVGTMDATDINFTANYLARLVKEHNLPPKVLVVHRYTQKMMTNYKLIKPLPEVEIVIHMDGWGGKAKKINTYQQFVYKEPVQFTGFKIFYKNDILGKEDVLMTPSDLMKLSPRPIYIQYQ